MAVSGGGGDRGAERRPSEFIARLVRDPRNPPEVVEIVGYVGAAAEAGRTRVYLDTTLQNYVEIEEGKILHVEPVAEAQLGLSHVFVAADAQIFPPPERPPRLDARSVFGGAVYQDYRSAETLSPVIPRESNPARTVSTTFGACSILLSSRCYRRSIYRKTKNADGQRSSACVLHQLQSCTHTEWHQAGAILR